MEQQPKQQSSDTEDFFSDHDTTELRGVVAKPVGMWQRFWRNTKLRVVLGFGVIILIGIVFLGLFLRSWQSGSTVLTDYVPGDAWLYAEFSLSPEEWRSLQEQRPHLASGVNSFFVDHGLSQQVISAASQIALASVKTDESFAWVWIVRTESPRQLEPFLLPGTFLRQPGTQIAVLSSNEEAVKEFSYRPGRSPAIPTRDVLWFGFLRPEQLADGMLIPSERFIYAYALKHYARQYTGDLLFEISLNNNNELYLTAGNNSIDNVVWPEDDQAYSLLIRSVSAASVFDNIENVLTDIPLAHYYWQQFQEQTAESYGLNWHVLQTLFDRPVSLFINTTGRRESGDTFEDVLGSFSFSDFSLLLSGAVSDSQRDFVDTLLLNILARQFPREKTVILADGTKATDLVVDPNRVEKESALGDSSVVYLSTTEQHIVRSADIDTLLISNRQEIPSLSFMEQDFYCGVYSDESIYLNSSVIQLVPWLSDFTDMLVSHGDGSFAVCLR